MGGAGSTSHPLFSLCFEPFKELVHCLFQAYKDIRTFSPPSGPPQAFFSTHPPTYLYVPPDCECFLCSQDFQSRELTAPCTIVISFPWQHWPGGMLGARVVEHLQVNGESMACRQWQLLNLRICIVDRRISSAYAHCPATIL